MTAPTAERDDGIAHRSSQVGDVRLHYVTAGAGYPLVLLHGWPQTWWQWRRVIPALAERYLVIAPDLRGLGDSSCPATGYDKKTIAEDIFRLVHDELGHKEVFLAGHDWGGLVAYAYASAHPHNVKRLAILDVVIPFGDTSAFTWGGRRWHHAFHWVPDLPEALTAGRERIYLSWFFTNLARNPSAITEADIDEYVRAYSRPGVMHAGFEYYRETERDVADNNENMKTKLNIPVLAVGGSHGRGKQVAENLQELAYDVRGRVIEDCGHWLPEESPVALSRELLEFFVDES